MKMGRTLANILIAALVPLSALATNDPLVGDLQAGRQKAKICASCHGLDGNAVVQDYPDLAGQNAAYLVYALNAYKNGWRFNGNAGIMRPQAAPLSDQDIADLAAYYASLAP
jgi:cytochrome c553